MRELDKADLSSRHMIEDEISKLYTNQPTEPRLRGLLKKDLSKRAFVDALEGTGATLALICDEGDVALKSEIFTQPSVLNAAWDGGAQQIDRADRMRVSVNDPRVTVALMVQPGVFDDYVRRRGDFARASGLFARFLVTQPDSRQGSRHMTESSEACNSWPFLDLFHAELQRLLDEGSTDRSVVCRLDRDAVSRWLQLVNEFESEMNPQGSCADIKDFTSKAGEMVLRLAALFHRVSGQDGLISCDTLVRASSVIGHHIKEFKQQFSSEFAKSDPLADANQLDHYLHRAFWNQGYSEISRNTVYRHGPIRQKRRFDEAVELMFQNRLCTQFITQSGKRILRSNNNSYQSNLLAAGLNHQSCSRIFEPAPASYPGNRYV